MKEKIAAPGRAIVGIMRPQDFFAGLALAGLGRVYRGTDLASVEVFEDSFGHAKLIMAYRGNDQPHPDNGMTLRDWYAGQYLQSVYPLLGRQGQIGADEFAAECWKYADAMLAERAEVKEINP